MKQPKVRPDTDFSFTTEQIARLERGLLSLRASNDASPKVIEAIAGRSNIRRSCVSGLNWTPRWGSIRGCFVEEG